MVYVIGSAKTGLIAHDRKFNFFVTKIHQYTTKFHCQNEEVLGCLLLLATSYQPMAIRMSGLGSSWSSGGKVED